MGYSKESVLPEQKVYCHTYDSLVGVLADRMVIREKVLLPQEGDSFDHEDIYSWISAVDLEDKGPKIEASLSAERGKNPITIDVEKQETIKSDDEKVSNETLLYSMALTEAKMKVISDIAEETYPAIAFQIKDYRREMEKIREEILGSVEKGSSLDEILSRMSTRRGFLISTLVIAGLVLAACNHLSTPEPTATPIQPQVTETSPAYETPGATETPFVEVTATAEVVIPTESEEVERYLEIAENVNAFLKAEGNYSEEELRKNPNWFLLDIDNSEPLPLGMITPIHLQAILVDYEVIGDQFHMLLGTYSKAGERIVFDYSFWKDTQLEIAMRKSGLANFSGDVPRVFTLNSEESDKYFDQYLGSPITIGTVTRIGPSDTLESVRSIIESLGLNYDLVKINWDKMGSSDSIKYYSDLEKNVNIVPDDFVKGSIEGENTVLYFNNSTAVTVDDISNLINGVSVGVYIFEVRNP